MAKLWVRKPGGAIRRKERMGVSPAGSLSLLWVSGSVTVLLTNSAVANASGLETQPPGSAGKLSRPATVKLLVFPAASAAHRWLKSVVAISGFCPSGTILPLAGEMGDWIEIVPCWPNCEEAEITLAVSGNRRLVVIEMFPPGPKTAFARI
ncbi:MAG TPA: hypothetical protein VLD60_04410 [Nitrospira sp.]|nr:hypothetical protein [Nitrospira sp.]